MVQGANDPRVNIDESDQIVEGLRANGVSGSHMVKYDEGHGFGKEENRMEFYQAGGILSREFKIIHILQHCCIYNIYLPKLAKCLEDINFCSFFSFSISSSIG